MALRWNDYTGAVVDFTAGWELTAEIVNYNGLVVASVASANIVGTATSPNVVVDWAVGFFLAFTPERYMVHLKAVEIATNRTRHFNLYRPPVIEILAKPLAV